MKIHIPSYLLALFLLSSCSPKTQGLSYFKDLVESNSGILQTATHINTISPENELVINVISDNPEASKDFNLPYVNPAVSGTKSLSSQPLTQTYLVDNKGNIDFPKLGTIHVAGMTTYELKEYLEKEISKYVKDPIVSISPANYKIVVMGEVRNPTTITTSADRFSVLDALAEAGDLTDYALRDNILVLRRTADNQIEYHRINLHDSKITQEPCFWLKNNDIVLVSPNQIKEDNSKYNQNNAYKLSVISTIVGASSAVISLIIALAIK